MPAYKLHYFNSRGRAEPSRLIFAAAGVQYQDIRYTPEEWQKIKQGTFISLVQVKFVISYLNGVVCEL